jgi:hypothetical protein
MKGIQYIIIAAAVLLTVTARKNKIMEMEKNAQK